MNLRAAKFFESIKGKRIAFCGVGVTNTPLIKMFCEKGFEVTVCDKRSEEALGEVGKELVACGAVLKTGEDYLDGIEADIIFRTPGMRYYLPQLCEYRRQGKVVTSEMELFFELCEGKTIAITGSNGKTTTTTVISKLLEKQGRKVYLGGNIGVALMPFIDEITEDDFVVVELSSFQLISMRQSPDIAIVTNLSPNHLDMHKDMDEYVDSKKNIMLHQNAFSTAIINADCPIVSKFDELARGRLLKFSRKEIPFNGAYADEKGDIYYIVNGEKQLVMNKSDIRIPGWHNVENYMAAVCAVAPYVDFETVKAVAREFGGVEHRAEFVREKDGVKYYNDSIATTPSRCISGTLAMYEQKIIMIAGGYDKLIPFDELGPVVCDKVKAIVLMGVTADKIEASVRNAENYSEGNPIIARVSSLEEAVNKCRELAEDGDIVSLCPACASFDMFPNYETRGEMFKDYVNKL